ncbi:hypothetical protein CWU58_12880 [Salmonella enterica]|uniref:Ead/Ea22-like family protein n=1 Tax=Salmonella enterica TaxID=28901 RepID=A0A744IUX9_SALER|nr:hypothetical protein [Salmonella enterica]HAF2528226.1 hypothetical protein [Salmonella enterica]
MKKINTETATYSVIEKGGKDGLTLNQLAERNAEYVAEISRLEAKCIAIVAENTALKSAKEIIRYLNANREEASFCGIDDCHIDDAAEAMITPATNAFLAELRTQARNELIDELGSRFTELSKTVEPPELRSGAAGAAAFVSAFRKGTELEIESSVNDAAIIELKQQYSRLQEARYDTPAVKDVIAERQRQQSVEGGTPEHDDEHGDGELALAASCYAENFALFSTWQDGESVDWSDAPQPANWPWSLEWWKPSSPRRDLVKAGALILAEIERGDRAFATDAKERGGVLWLK